MRPIQVRRPGFPSKSELWLSPIAGFPGLRSRPLSFITSLRTCQTCLSTPCAKRALRSCEPSERHLRLSRTSRRGSLARFSSSQRRSGQAGWRAPQSRAGRASSPAVQRSSHARRLCACQRCLRSKLPFTDCLCIGRVVLAAFDIGLDVDRRDQPHIVSHRQKLARPIMG